MPTEAATGTWSLEVVRGRDVGRVYALGPGEVVLGSAPGFAAAIDLADQEGPGPRRMADRQASLECIDGRLAVRDLDSPGGTFVNRRRVLPGRAEPLGPGDVIQLGGVQLRVGRSGPVPASAAPQTAPTPPASVDPAVPLALPGGAACRTWDDMLTVSAQRWAAFRDELTSGRLAAWCVRAGRPDLAPSPSAAGSADERLDAWLASLPTSKPRTPELDAHPTRLTVRLAPGSGATRRAVRVANVGYRLLRVRARVDPSGTPWLAVAPGQAGQEVFAVEDAEISIELSPPDDLAGPLRAALVLEGNGGARRVEVVLELAGPRGEPIPDAAPAGSGDLLDDFRGSIARQPAGVRRVGWPVAFALGRAAIAAGGALVSLPGEPSPGLAGPAVLFGGLGAILGARLALKRGGPGDLPACAFAGAGAGVLAAALAVAACRSVEPLLGPRGGSLPVAFALWALLGLAAALASLKLAPYLDDSSPPSSI